MCNTRLFRNFRGLELKLYLKNYYKKTILPQWYPAVFCKLCRQTELTHSTWYLCCWPWLPLSVYVDSKLLESLISLVLKYVYLYIIQNVPIFTQHWYISIYNEENGQTALDLFLARAASQEYSLIYTKIQDYMQNDMVDA